MSSQSGDDVTEFFVDVRLNEEETLAEVLTEVTRGLTGVVAVPTGVRTADGHPEVRFGGPADKLKIVRERFENPTITGTSTRTRGEPRVPDETRVAVPLNLVLRATADSGNAELATYLLENYGDLVSRLEIEAIVLSGTPIQRVRRIYRTGQERADEVVRDQVNRGIDNVKRLARDLFG